MGLGRPGSQSRLAVSAAEVSYTQQSKEVKGLETQAISLGFFPQALLNPGNCQRTSGGLL